MARNKVYPFIDDNFSRNIRWGSPVLVSRFGEEKARSIIGAVHENYGKLKGDIPEMKTDLAQRLLMTAVTLLPLYQRVIEELREEEALEIVYDFGEIVVDKEMTENISPIIRAVLKNRYLYPLVTKFTRGKMTNSNDPHGWEYEFLPKQKGHLIDFNVKSCGMHKFLSRQEAPELTRVLCRYDIFVAEKYLPECMLVRTKTIAEGGEYCDFRYVRA